MSAMPPVHAKYLNLSFSISYGLVSALIFIVLQFLSLLSPVVSGILVFYFGFQLTGGKNPPTPLTLILIAGGIGSLLVGINMLRALKLALSTPEEGNALQDPKVLSLIQGIASDVGVSPFSAVYLNSGIDISTFYTARGRYLNLSVLALGYLTSNELKALIAHECAHHHDNAMLFHRIHYRATLMFYSYSQAISAVFSTYERVSKNKFLSNMANLGGIPLITLVPYIHLYSLFLSLMANFIGDSDYEYYCDEVSINYVGANIFTAALQKVLDLYIADQTIANKTRGNSSTEQIGFSRTLMPSSTLGPAYLQMLEQEYNHIRRSNPPLRHDAAKVKTNSHPPIASRLRRAQGHLNRPDYSTTMLSNVEMRKWWMSLTS
jgi:Zn-dependent protease with chaperone function